MGSGGDIEQFNAWEQNKKFLTKKQYNDLHNAMANNRDLYNQMLKEFQPQLESFLETVWDAPKPLTYLAEKAKNSSSTKTKKP